MTTGVKTPASVRAEIAGQYVIDPTHSRIGFGARHAMVAKVRGTFNEFEGGGYFDVDDPSKSSLALTIKTASIDTRSPDRDAHLRSNDFFDMDSYPEIRFVSRSVDHLDGESYRITGDLTIKGITKPVAFDVSYNGSSVDPFGNGRIGLEGKATVNRKDWGVNWNAPLEAGGVLVSENVTLEFEVSAIRTDN